MVQDLKQMQPTSAFKLASTVDCGNHNFNVAPWTIGGSTVAIVAMHASCILKIGHADYFQIPSYSSECIAGLNWVG